MILAPKIMNWTVNICSQARFCLSKKKKIYLDTLYIEFSVTVRLVKYLIKTLIHDIKLFFYLPIGYDIVITPKYIHVYHTHIL